MLSSQLKSKILSTYSKYNDEDVELEARFGHFTKRFNPGVTRQIYNRIKEYFDLRTTPIHESTTDYIMGKVRKTIVHPQDNKGTEEIIWIIKDRLWNQQNRDYGIRYSMSRELLTNPIPDSQFIPEIIREKTRSSYLVFGNSVRIDITLVNMISGSHIKSKESSKDSIKYEVEVELLERSKLDLFSKAVIVTLRLIQDTITLYTNSERLEIVDYVNHVLDSGKRGILDHYPIVQARNLKLRDMVFRGLIGNEETGYSVTHKADGQRKLLVFHRSGIWLLMAPNFVNRITDKQIPTLYGTILDGEMLPVPKRKDGAPESKIWYLAFDSLAYNGDNSIQNKPHGQRMQFAQSVADMLKTNLITVNTKSFKNFATPQEFFKIMREMFREQPLLVYEQDGFMFQPQNTKYNPHSDKNPLYKRILTKYPDICKWKPKEQLTIDFLIKWIIDPNTLKKSIELWTAKKGKPVKFTGTEIFPYNGEVDSEHPLTIDIPNNTIVEYGWDYDRELLFPHVIRNNKTKPNRLEIVEDVWTDIHVPLTQETLKGDTFTLLRKYHNRIKKKLFNSVREEKTLLDIGSGRGGDVTKWKSFDKIVAVEPNPEHIVELKRRIKLNNMENKVRVVQAGGEDTTTIYKAVRDFIGDRVDVVSMMLSLTFFWQSSGLVDSLVNTLVTNLKPKGKYIFLTMDGDLVEQTFEPAFDTGPQLTKLELGPATLQYFPDKTPKELHIDIKDSIVSDQTEWLVRLDDLRLRMNQYGFNYDYIHKADEEKFLTQEEIIMTQMYSYAKMTGTGKELPELKDIKRPQIVYSPRSEHVMSPTSELPPVQLTLPPLSQKIKADTLKKEQIKVSSPALPPMVLPSVTVPIEIEEKDLESIKMDTHEVVKVSWYPDEKIVRIGAIGDGSCFFHAILNAYLKMYQINSSPKFRRDFVQKLRRDIAESLKRPSSIDPSKNNYEIASGGQFVSLYEQQKLGVDFKDVFDYPIDFSLEGLYKLFNSSSYLGDEVYQYASDLLGIDIYIMRLTTKDLYLHSNTYKKDNLRPSVVISGNGNHFETIGIERDGLFQTFYTPDDPFLTKIRSKIK